MNYRELATEFNANPDVDDHGGDDDKKGGGDDPD